jgi:hypothetical protein
MAKIPPINPNSSLYDGDYHVALGIRPELTGITQILCICIWILPARFTRLVRPRQLRLCGAADAVLGYFLPWHRAYLNALEGEMKDRCGYKGWENVSLAISGFAYCSFRRTAVLGLDQG